MGVSSFTSFFCVQSYVNFLKYGKNTAKKQRKRGLKGAAEDLRITEHTLYHSDALSDGSDAGEAEVLASVLVAEGAVAEVGGRGGKVDDAAEGLRLEERARSVADEVERHVAFHHHDAFGTGTASETAERRDAEEFFGFDGERPTPSPSLRGRRVDTFLRCGGILLSRHAAEAVDETLTEGGNLFVVEEAVEFAVEQHAFARAGNVTFREISS